MSCKNETTTISDFLHQIFEVHMFPLKFKDVGLVFLIAVFLIIFNCSSVLVASEGVLGMKKGSAAITRIANGILHEFRKQSRMSFQNKPKKQKADYAKSP